MTPTQWIDQNIDGEQAKSGCLAIVSLAAPVFGEAKISEGALHFQTTIDAETVSVMSIYRNHFETTAAEPTLLIFPKPVRDKVPAISDVALRDYVIGAFSSALKTENRSSGPEPTFLAKAAAPASCHENLRQVFAYYRHRILEAATGSHASS